MATDKEGVANRPYLLFLTQIDAEQENSGISKPKIKQLADGLTTWQLNFSLPIVCLTDEQDKYHLMTGLPIYEAALEAKLERIWVFLIATKQAEAEKAIEQALLQSKLNERIVEQQDITEFLNFVNDPKAKLTSIPGIKKYVQQIREHGTYSSLEEMKNKLGCKRVLTWVRAYKHKQVKVS